MISRKHAFSLWALCLALWFLLSGHTAPLLLGLGVLSAAITVFIALRMEIIDHESHPLALSHKLVPYWFWLAGQTVRAALKVSRIVLSRRPQIDSVVGNIPTGERSDIGRAIFANSITLTPGTVTLNVWEQHIEVYAISHENLKELQRGEMLRRIPDPGAKT